MFRVQVMTILAIMISSFAWAQESSLPSAGQENKTTYLICKNGPSVRTLRVLTEKNGGCVTTYTKEGVDQSVAHSWKSDRCSKVLANIRINLEKAQWKCKDISEARVSSSE